ncbi:MAG: hypothetical protein GXY08_06990 [Ruminococcus sp.]|nr:hypothetical protein [Ruminococcus sp.]
MNRNGVIITGIVCAVAGIAAGMGTMYGIQKKKIDFANNNSVLMEVQQILDENDKKLPEGVDPEKASAKGYMSLFDIYTTYVDKNEEAEDYDNRKLDVEAEMINGNVLLAKINGFASVTSISFSEKVTPLIPNASGMIIDLRNNGGGEIVEENSISDLFLKTGVVHCFIDNDDDYDFEMGDSGNEFSLPVVILVNGKTASASEMMTALFMQNYDNVTVVGTQTFGKGVFQDVKELSNGDEIKFTNGYYTVGDWECYNEIGITPDIVLEMDESLIGTFSDTQLKKALELLG